MHRRTKGCRGLRRATGPAGGRALDEGNQVVFSKLRTIAIWLVLAATLLGSGLPGSALAQTLLTPRDRVIAALEEQGYQVTRVRKTWLGRVQIRARAGDLRREIVLNPNTGEVLRDYVETIGRDDDDRRAGSGRHSGRDDDDDDDNSGSGSRDDDDHDDNSGPGSSDDDDSDDDDDSRSDSDDD